MGKKISRFSNFDFLNESVFGIDINEIKKSAKEFASSRECIFALSTIEPSLLKKFILEIKSSLKKFKGNIDLLIQTFLKKFSEKELQKNEGFIATSILYLFGFNSLMAVLGKLKNSWSFVEFFEKLTFNGVKSSISTILFLILMVGYLISSNVPTINIIHSKSDNRYFNLPLTWDGFDNYNIYDGKEKKYTLKPIKSEEFAIYYNNNLIGFQDTSGIKNLKGEIVFTYHKKDPNDKDPNNDLDISNVKLFDLEERLTKTVNPKMKAKLDNLEKDKKSISDHLKSVSTEMDSLSTHLYENLSQARKMMVDHSEQTKKRFIDPDKVKYVTIREMVFDDIKSQLEKDNRLGYIVFFTKFIVGCPDYILYKLKHSIMGIYDQMVSNNDILSKLRDPKTREIKNVMEFNSLDDLAQALDNLTRWKKLNKFIKELPPTQKNLIWKNGWFINSLEKQSEYLESSMLKIMKDEDLKRMFFDKVSSLKDISTFIRILSNLTKNEPWDFDFYLDKINSTRNALITWVGDNQIICAVFTHTAIKEIANRTNWCIVREKSQFYNYFSKGNQFILYDFNFSKENDKSIIGFTVDTHDKLVACHDRSDAKSFIHRPPMNKFVIGGYSIKTSYMKKEFIKIDFSKMKGRLDIKIYNIVRQKLRNLLNAKHVSKFIDWWTDTSY